jgi:hypothetical protein
MKYARAMRDKYGLNLWVDGTVTRGWHILAHKDRADNAQRMFLSVVHDLASPT